MSAIDLTRFHDPEVLKTLSDEELGRLIGHATDLTAEDRKLNQILYYRAASERAEKVHYSTAGIVGVGGGNRCQVAGTRVITNRGAIAIEEVSKGDKVAGRQRWPGVVTDIHKSSEPMPIYRLTTKRGYTMFGSAEHMNLVCPSRRRDWHNGQDADYKAAEWLELSALARHDFEKSWRYIAMSAGGGFPETCEITPDDSYFFGLMIGDGSYCGTGYRRHVMNYTTHSDDIVLILWVSRYLSQHDVKHRIARKSGRTNGAYIAWCSARFAKWLVERDLQRQRGPYKTIPETVWRGTRAVVAAFLRGFADSDGCATTKPSVVYINRSYELMRGVHILLRRFGINASLRKQSANVRHKRPNDTWRLEICGANVRRYAAEIGFLLPSKTARLPNKPPPLKPTVQQRWDRIISVEPDDEQTVYGLTISPEPHYMADGFLQHNSSKTETCIVEAVALSTGVFPMDYHDLFMKKFRGPINVRMICESLTTTLYPTILPKLQYWRWSGIDQQGGKRGHWGWIPKKCLIDGSWDKSWKTDLRRLRVLCYDPENPDRVLGESYWQHMSYDQDPEDFASGTFHIILHDEPPKYAIWQESEARVLDVGGRLLLAMTWPDDPAIAVDWIFDEIYEKGRPGPNKDPNVDWFELYTTENVHMDQEVIATKTASWNATKRQVRMFGQPIRFSNRIHPLYTDTTQFWCFTCGRTIIPVKQECPTCGDKEYSEFCHFREFETQPSFPAVFLLDPHPRKPHMFMWVQIDGNDDWWVVAEGEVDEDPTQVRAYVDDVEGNLSLNVQLRLMDPNMGRSPSSATKRESNWQDEFAEAGLVCDLADDGSVGRAKVNEMLRPDEFTKRPRLHIHSRCLNTNTQIHRYAWDEFRQSLDKDLKQKPREKYDDYPTLLKYLANWNPTFSALSGGRKIIQRPGKRKGAY